MSAWEWTLVYREGGGSEPAIAGSEPGEIVERRQRLLRRNSARRFSSRHASVAAAQTGRSLP
jgi:hypothetical protein